MSRSDHPHVKPAGWQARGIPSETVTPSFDPGAHTVGDTLGYVAQHPDQRAAVYELELAGKARSTLLTKLATEQT